MHSGASLAPPPTVRAQRTHSLRTHSAHRPASQPRLLATIEEMAAAPLVVFSSLNFSSAQLTAHSQRTLTPTGLDLATARRTDKSENWTRHSASTAPPPAYGPTALRLHASQPRDDRRDGAAQLLLRQLPRLHDCAGRHLAVSRQQLAAPHVLDAQPLRG